MSYRVLVSQILNQQSHWPFPYQQVQKCQPCRSTVHAKARSEGLSEGQSTDGNEDTNQFIHNIPTSDTSAEEVGKTAFDMTSEVRTVRVSFKLTYPETSTEQQQSDIDAVLGQSSDEIHLRIKDEA